MNGELWKTEPKDTRFKRNREIIREVDRELAGKTQDAEEENANTTSIDVHKNTEITDATFPKKEYKTWLKEHFNGLDWSLLVKHLVIEDIHNSWLYWTFLVRST